MHNLHFLVLKESIFFGAKYEAIQPQFAYYLVWRKKCYNHVETVFRYAKENGGSFFIS